MKNAFGAKANVKVDGPSGGAFSQFSARRSWLQASLHGIVGRFSGAQLELNVCWPQHSIVLTLGGGSKVTGTRISGTSIYEGHDARGCVSFVPAGTATERWYRAADMEYVALFVAPEFVESREFERALSAVSPFTNHRDALLESILSSLAREMHNDVSSCYAEHAAGLVLAHLTRSVWPDRAEARVYRSVRGGLVGWRLRRVLEHIEDHLNEEISLAELSMVAGLSQRHFGATFRRTVGEPPHQYLVARRIARAQALFQRNRALSVTEVAMAVGFTASTHFATVFRKVTGQSPTAYRDSS
ncbi:MAG: helix-turn-helix transcriptional regulator [Proteobacteria bacterium]|nr:helix-turn-helix transcriptional regulator [Burkholderiales bacterium]